MNGWFLYFLKRSISERRGRFAIASLAVMLTVTVVTALATLSLGIRDKIGAELKQYGANMIVTDRSGREIGAGVAQEIRSRQELASRATFQVYGTAVLKQVTVEIMGAEPDRMSGYRVFGKMPQAPDELMAGINLKEPLKLRQGDTVRFDGKPGAYTVTALFEKGSDEDSTIVMPLEGAQKLLGMAGVSAVLLNVDPRRLPDTENALRAAYPFLEVKTLRQVAVAEERILRRVQLLMLMVTAVVLFASMIALGSTMAANVIERREEIGLMKSLGATRRHIRAVFMAEAAGAGLFGAAIGYLAGCAVAEAVSRTAFGSFIAVNVLAAPLMVALGICIAVLSAYFPVRDAMKIVPAQILRGE